MQDEENEAIDIGNEYKELKELETARQLVDEKLENILQQILIAQDQRGERL